MPNRFQVLYTALERWAKELLIPTDAPPTDWSWLIWALVACIELTFTVTVINARRLLKDRSFFESVLPLPMNSPLWGHESGVEHLIQWHRLPTEKRHAALLVFERLIPPPNTHIATRLDADA